MVGSSPRMRGTLIVQRLYRFGCGDHPRACGEHKGGQSFDCRQQGSSPRMRGTQLTNRTATCTPGIIPAHAGNTPSMRSSMARVRDHPRACGEHALDWESQDNPQESSPRMRGTQYVRVRHVGGDGIIPAHAGNTLPAATSEDMSRDHPRACGEHSSLCQMHATMVGSSPRMRGTPVVFAAVRTEHGIIPAHAGNTSLRMSVAHAIWDHPRACGEHDRHRLRPSQHPGSSPRMRGTHREQRDRHAAAGIIPAHAGNTPPSARCMRRWWDHPRACGEHSLQYAMPGSGTGSSPRMRGTLIPRVSNSTIGGIIPAHAGNTNQTAFWASEVKDHPRACGEHAGEKAPQLVHEGSSPRMRGTRIVALISL